MSNFEPRFGVAGRFGAKYCRARREHRFKVLFDLRLSAGPTSRRTVCLFWILSFPVCTTVLCAPHERVLSKTSFADFVGSVCFPFNVPSDAVAVAEPAGSNVSCRWETERTDMANGKNLAYQRLGGESQTVLWASSERGRSVRVYVSWQHYVDDSASGCSLRGVEFLRQRVLAEIPHAACDSRSPHLAPTSGCRCKMTEVSQRWQESSYRPFATSVSNQYTFSTPTDLLPFERWQAALVEVTAPSPEFVFFCDEPRVIQLNPRLAVFF